VAWRGVLEVEGEGFGIAVYCCCIASFRFVVWCVWFANAVQL
jgi:hypothetical protein